VHRRYPELRTLQPGAEWTKRVDWRCAGPALLLVTVVSCLIKDNWLQSHGRVVDRQSGKPIAGAVIRFYGSHLPDTGIRVSTDSLGRFRVFHGASTATQLERLLVEAPMYQRATFRPEVMGAHLPPVEIQLAAPLAREPSRMLKIDSGME
jgi:hypothetical protein